MKQFVRPSDERYCEMFNELLAKVLSVKTDPDESRQSMAAKATITDSRDEAPTRANLSSLIDGESLIPSDASRSLFEKAKINDFKRAMSRIESSINKIELCPSRNRTGPGHSNADGRRRRTGRF